MANEQDMDTKIAVYLGDTSMHLCVKYVPQGGRLEALFISVIDRCIFPQDIVLFMLLKNLTRYIFNVKCLTFPGR